MIIKKLMPRNEGVLAPVDLTLTQFSGQVIHKFIVFLIYHHLFLLSFLLIHANISFLILLGLKLKAAVTFLDAFYFRHAETILVGAYVFLKESHHHFMPFMPNHCLNIIIFENVARIL